MPGASLFAALNAALDGEACERLHQWQTEGLSLDAITERIAAEIGWSPGRESIRRYLTGECR